MNRVLREVSRGWNPGGMAFTGCEKGANRSRFSERSSAGAKARLSIGRLCGTTEVVPLLQSPSVSTAISARAEEGAEKEAFASEGGLGSIPPGLKPINMANFMRGLKLPPPSEKTAGSL